MACSRKALSAGYNTLSQRFRPSLVHIVQDDCELSGIPQSETLSPILLMQPPSSSLGLFSCFKSPARDCRRMGFYFPLGIDRSSRCFSSSAEGSNEIGGYMSDIADVLTDTKVDTAIEAATSTVPAPFPGEVAAAAADSFLPVAALQHLIDSVHSFSGLNWWASIALTTLLIRGATVPLLINQLKATIKLNVMRPELEKLKAEIDKNMNPETFQENKKQMKALFKKHGVTPFTPLKGLFIQGPVFICFFVAIRNMVEKVPSFKGGGAYWFTDLTTPDDLYILPVLTAALFLATVELNMQEGMEGNPMANTMKKFSRGLGILTIPFTASIPKAIFCYWVTSNLFSLAYGFVMKRAPVRKLLSLPDGMIPKPSSALPPQPNLFSFSAGYKPTAASSVPDRKTAPEQRQPNSISRSKDNDKIREGRQRSSPSAAISQRIRNLEKTVRSRTKPSKKR